MLDDVSKREHSLFTVEMQLSVSNYTINNTFYTIIIN